MQGKIPTVPVFNSDDDKAHKRTTQTTNTLTEDEREEAEEKKFERKLTRMERAKKLMKVAGSADDAYDKVSDAELGSIANTFMFWIGVHIVMAMLFTSLLQTAENPLDSMGIILIVHGLMAGISLFSFLNVVVTDYKLKWSGQIREPSTLVLPLDGWFGIGGVKAAFFTYMLAVALFSHVIVPLYCVCSIKKIHHPIRGTAAWTELIVALLSAVASIYFLEMWRRHHTKETEYEA